MQLNHVYGIFTKIANIFSRRLHWSAKRATQKNALKGDVVRYTSHRNVRRATWKRPRCRTLRCKYRGTCCMSAWQRACGHGSKAVWFAASRRLEQWNARWHLGIRRVTTVNGCTSLTINRICQSIGAWQLVAFECQRQSITWPFGRCLLNIKRSDPVRQNNQLQLFSSSLRDQPINDKIINGN